MVLGFALTFGMLALFVVIAFQQIRRVDTIMAASDAGAEDVDPGASHG